MAAVKHIVLALLGAAESREPALLTQGVEALVSACEQLVGIGLMADIPDKLIARGIKLLMHGERQLHNAEIRREVTAVLRHGVDKNGAYLGGKLVELSVAQVFYIRRGMYIFKVLVS